MSRPTPRRPASSRAATPRPRRIAGGRPGDSPVEQPVEQPVHDVAAEPGSPVDGAADGGTSEARLEPWPVDDGDPEGPETPGSALGSPRLTRMLLVVVGILGLLLVLQGLWLVRHEYFRDEPAAADVAEGEIDVPEDRPVLPTELAVQEGVEAAADAAVRIVSRTFQKYDEEVDEATALMTPEFAEEYRVTTDDVREEFIAKETTVEARVVGQGVVRANDTELQALVFLNHYVVRGTGDDAKTVYTPYRALLTMVNTDDGWLVADLDTK